MGPSPSHDERYRMLLETALDNMVFPCLVLGVWRELPLDSPTKKCPPNLHVSSAGASLHLFAKTVTLVIIMDEASAVQKS